MATADTPSQQVVHALYSDHHGWLHGWLRNKLGCSERAADLAHDTFLRVLLKRELPALREPRAYLTTIATGLLRNFWRRQALEQAYLDVLATLPEALAPSPEQRWLLLEALTEIDALLDGLPRQVRSAFLLSQLDGMGYPEIAEKLGISVRTVKRHMVRAFTQCLSALA